MSESHTVRISVYGKEYTIKTSEDPSITLEYAEYIDGKMKEIGQKTGSFDPNRVATLALLSITHELFALRRKLDHDRETLVLKATALEEKVNSALSKTGLAGRSDE